MIVYVYSEHDRRWHVLVSAHPGGRITASCGVSMPYFAVSVATQIVAEHRCVVCSPPRALPDDHNFDLGDTPAPWSCPANSRECQIRKACTNKCGQLDGITKSGDL